MEEKIREAYAPVKPDDKTRAAMLEQLLAEAESLPQEPPVPARKKQGSRLLKWALPAAAAAIAAVVLLPRLDPPAPEFHEELPATEETVPAPVPEKPAVESVPPDRAEAAQTEAPPVIHNGPMLEAGPAPEEQPIRASRPAVGVTAPAPRPRRLAYGGGSYAPLGEETVEKTQLEEPLTTVGADQSFPEGSVVFSLTDTDPDFRLAVEQEDGWLLLQRLAGGDLSRWLTAAGEVEGISVTDPAQRVVLQELTPEQTEQLLGLLRESPAATLSAEESRAVEADRREKAALRLNFRLPDAPSFAMELLPRRELVAMDGQYYELPRDFDNTFGSYFEALLGGRPQP